MNESLLLPIICSYGIVEWSKNTYLNMYNGTSISIDLLPYHYQSTMVWLKQNFLFESKFENNSLQSCRNLSFKVLIKTQLLH